MHVEQAFGMLAPGGAAVAVVVVASAAPSLAPGAVAGTGRWVARRCTVDAHCVRRSWAFSGIGANAQDSGLQSSWVVLCVSALRWTISVARSCAGTKLMIFPFASSSGLCVQILNDGGMERMYRFQ